MFIPPLSTTNRGVITPSISDIFQTYPCFRRIRLMRKPFTVYVCVVYVDDFDIRPVKSYERVGRVLFRARSGIFFLVYQIKLFAYEY